jgi:hypothetical protein
MSWNGESRAIKEALRREHRIEHDICPLCKTNNAHVHCASKKYDRVMIICNDCAQIWIKKYLGTDSIPADKIYELLYFDNTQITNYRSNEVEKQQMRLF